MSEIAALDKAIEEAAAGEKDGGMQDIHSIYSALLRKQREDKLITELESRRNPFICRLGTGLDALRGPLIEAMMWTRKNLPEGRAREIARNEIENRTLEAVLLATRVLPVIRSHIGRQTTIYYPGAGYDFIGPLAVSDAERYIFVSLHRECEGLKLDNFTAILAQIRGVGAFAISIAEINDDTLRVDFTLAGLDGEERKRSLVYLIRDARIWAPSEELQVLYLANSPFAFSREPAILSTPLSRLQNGGFLAAISSGIMDPVFFVERISEQYSGINNQRIIPCYGENASCIGVWKKEEQLAGEVTVDTHMDGGEMEDLRRLAREFVIGRYWSGDPTGPEELLGGRPDRDAEVALLLLLLIEDSDNAEVSRTIERGGYKRLNSLLRSGSFKQGIPLAVYNEIECALDHRVLLMRDYWDRFNGLKASEQIGLLDGIIADVPEYSLQSLNALLLKGNSLSNLKKCEEALAVYNEVIAKAQDWEGWNGEDCLKRVRKEREYALSHKSRMLCDLGRINELLELCVLADRGSGSFKDIVENAGRYLLNLKDAEAAFSCLGEALKKMPGDLPPAPKIRYDRLFGQSGRRLEKKDDRYFMDICDEVEAVGYLGEIIYQETRAGPLLLDFAQKLTEKRHYISGVVYDKIIECLEKILKIDPENRTLQETRDEARRRLASYLNAPHNFYRKGKTSLMESVFDKGNSSLDEDDIAFILLRLPDSEQASRKTDEVNLSYGPRALLDVFYSYRFMNIVPDCLLERIAAALDKKNILYADIREMYERKEYAAVMRACENIEKHIVDTRLRLYQKLRFWKSLAMTWVDDGCNVSNGVHYLMGILFEIRGRDGNNEGRITSEEDREFYNQVFLCAAEAAWRTGNYYVLEELCSEAERFPAWPKRNAAASIFISAAEEVFILAQREGHIFGMKLFEKALGYAHKALVLSAGNEPEHSRITLFTASIYDRLDNHAKVIELCRGLKGDPVYYEDARKLLEKNLAGLLENLLLYPLEIRGIEITPALILELLSRLTDNSGKINADYLNALAVLEFLDAKAFHDAIDKISISEKNRELTDLFNNLLTERDGNRYLFAQSSYSIGMLKLLAAVKREYERLPKELREEIWRTLPAGLAEALTAAFFPEALSKKHPEIIENAGPLNLHLFGSETLGLAVCTAELLRFEQEREVYRSPFDSYEQYKTVNIAELAGSYYRLASGFFLQESIILLAALRRLDVFILACSGIDDVLKDKELDWLIEAYKDKTGMDRQRTLEDADLKHLYIFLIDSAVKSQMLIRMCEIGMDILGHMQQEKALNAGEEESSGRVRLRVTFQTGGERLTREINSFADLLEETRRLFREASGRFPGIEPAGIEAVKESIMSEEAGLLIKDRILSGLTENEASALQMMSGHHAAAGHLGSAKAEESPGKDGGIEVREWRFGGVGRVLERAEAEAALFDVVRRLLYVPCRLRRFGLIEPMGLSGKLLANAGVEKVTVGETIDMSMVRSTETGEVLRVKMRKSISGTRIRELPVVLKTAAGEMVLLEGYDKAARRLREKEPVQEAIVLHSVRDMADMGSRSEGFLGSLVELQTENASDTLPAEKSFDEFMIRLEAGGSDDPRLIEEAGKKARELHASGSPADIEKAWTIVSVLAGFLMNRWTVNRAEVLAALSSVCCVLYEVSAHPGAAAAVQAGYYAKAEEIRDILMRDAEFIVAHVNDSIHRECMVSTSFRTLVPVMLMLMRIRLFRKVGEAMLVYLRGLAREAASGNSFLAGILDDIINGTGNAEACHFDGGASCRQSGDYRWLSEKTGLTGIEVVDDLYLAPNFSLHGEIHNGWGGERTMLLSGTVLAEMYNRSPPSEEGFSADELLTLYAAYKVLESGALSSSDTPPGPDFKLFCRHAGLSGEHAQSFLRYVESAAGDPGKSLVLQGQPLAARKLLAAVRYTDSLIDRNTAISCFSYPGRHEPFLKWFLNIHPGARGNFVDLGCGIGLIGRIPAPVTSLACARMFPGLTVYAVDRVIPRVAVRNGDHWGMFDGNGNLRRILYETRLRNGESVFDIIYSAGEGTIRGIKKLYERSGQYPGIPQRLCLSGSPEDRDASGQQEIFFEPFTLAVREAGVKNIVFV
ncbi:MAG: hypothetical protein WC418_06440, partial [Candidatus Omnitrophota bacterium]